MISYEDECVGCGLPCLGDSCKYKHVAHMYCDECGEEHDTLYEVDDQQLCAGCLLDSFPIVRLE